MVQELQLFKLSLKENQEIDLVTTTMVVKNGDKQVNLVNGIEMDTLY